MEDRREVNATRIDEADIHQWLVRISAQWRRRLAGSPKGVKSVWLGTSIGTRKPPFRVLWTRPRKATPP
jgi:hypothetical protein